MSEQQKILQNISVKSEVQKFTTEKIQQLSTASNDPTKSIASMYDDLKIVNAPPIRVVDFNECRNWATQGDNTSYRSQHVFISTTRGIAAVKSKDYGNNVHRNPYVTLFSTAVIAFMLPHHNSSYVKKLRQMYPFFEFDVQPIGKFVLWPPKCQHKSQEMNDRIVTGLIKIYIERNNNETNKFLKRVAKFSAKAKSQMQEEKDKTAEITKEIERLQKIDDNYKQKMLEENKTENLNDTTNAENDSGTLTAVEEHHGNLVEEEMYQKRTLKDLRFAMRFLHDINRPINKSYIEVPDEKALKDCESPFYYNEKLNCTVVKNNFRYPVVEDYMLCYKYAVVCFIELLDEEILTSKVLELIPGIKGLYKLSGFTVSMDDAEALMKQCNDQYNNIFTHHVVEINGSAPYPPRYDYMKDILIDESKKEEDIISKRFMKNFRLGLNEQRAECEKRENESYMYEELLRNRLEVMKSKEEFECRLAQQKLTEEEQFFYDNFVPLNTSSED